MPTVLHQQFALADPYSAAKRTGKGRRTSRTLQPVLFLWLEYRRSQVHFVVSYLSLPSSLLISGHLGILELAISVLLSFRPPIADGYPPAQLLVVFPRLCQLLFQRIELHDEVRVRGKKPHLSGWVLRHR